MSAAVANTTDATTNNTNWRGFSTTETNVIEAQFPDKIEGPSTWDGKELEKQPEKWIYHVTPEDIADIDKALKHFKSLDLPLVCTSISLVPIQPKANHPIYNP